MSPLPPDVMAALDRLDSRDRWRLQWEERKKAATPDIMLMAYRLEKKIPQVGHGTALKLLQAIGLHPLFQAIVEREQRE